MTGLKILIVDDDPLVSDLIRRKLIKTSPSLNITAVSSASECLEYIAGNPVDCIVSDYQMPGMDGMELLDSIRRTGDITPFIFVTGQGNEEVAREAFKRGAYDYFTKEVGFAHFDRITNSIKQAVRHRRAEDNRSEAERMLQEQKSKLDAIIASIADGLCIVNRDFMLVYSNQAYLDMIGDHVGRNCFEFIEGRESICDDCPVDKTFRDGQAHRTRKFSRHKGKEIIVDISSSPLKDQNGNIVAAVKVVRDVTEQNMADRILAESEDKFRTLAEKSPNMIFINQGGGIVYANELCEKMTGYKRDELYDPGFDFRRLIAPESMELVESNFMKHTRGENVDPYEYDLLTKDGERLTVLITTRLINFGDGRAVLGIVTDITDRTLAERALKESEAVNKAIIGALPDPVFLFDRDGRFIDIRAADEGSLYVPRDDALMNKITDVLPEDVSRLALENISNALGTGKLQNFEYRLNIKGGARDFEARLAPIGLADRVLGIVRDVTERKLTEDAIRNISEGVSAATGDEFFRSLVTYLAKTLGVDYALIGELTGDGLDAVATTSVYAHGVIIENIVYKLAGTPCANVIEAEPCCYSSGVQSMYPDDDLLVEMGVDSYAGTTLFGTDGRPMGILVVLDSKPMANEKFTLSLLQIFASRASSEMERLKAFEAVRESEARLRTLMENANDAILLADAKTGIITDANKKAEEIFGYGREKLIGMHQSLLHPTAEAEMYKALFAEHVARGEALTGDLLIQRCDGSTLPVEISSSVVEISGRKTVIGLLRDITERKQAEEEKDRLLKGISTITDGIAFVDKDGRYVYMNDAHARMFGYETDELIGRTWRDIVPPDKVETIEEVKRTTLRVREIGKLAGDGMGLRKDGMLFPMEFNLAGFFDAEGGFEGHVCIARDITGRRAIEEKLAKSEESYKEAENIARIGNWEWVIDKDEVNWSDGMFSIFGLDPDEFGKTYNSYLDYVHPDDKDRVTGQVAESLNGAPLDYTTRVICPDGRNKVIHVYGRLSYDDKGRPARLFGTVQDVTERTLAEKALRASEERHRVIFETSAVGIMVADPDGNIYEANPALCGMLGYSEDELINMSVFELTHTADLEESKRLTAELNSGYRDVIDVEKRYVHRDGHPVWARATVTRHHVLGMQQPYNIGFILDITGRKTLEKQREELFSMLRHDMKTPLAVISGNADMVIADCRANLDPESLSMIESMKASALSLTRMVDDLVAISKLESGDLAIDKEPVDIMELLIEASVVASERSRAKGLHYERDVPENLPRMFLSRSYVQRAVANLLDNAVKYTPSGGAVSLKAGVSRTKGGSILNISVTDTGPGISENEINMIFEKHYRSPRTPSQSGSGLGLSIVKAVATIHGGGVELTTLEGSGSTFTLNLPVD